ncbi:hypothetical protein COCSUDRAFT_44249 [Coccomyxa subellipsoidea C-169]|uniref:Uncharacterized protein n=1 Tax=Coccomyxa subellipsoidea (strain C-169) TaxID=574566 RepID=I0YN54_COCSC|nr:hypothetical protein COCSUDRAFT_44249 [Coccomyxa subellipsoidea C-169]EIE19823.1 hypothetical protein COCSUDRAFT_44249 [Coccomyxa subellipsoidea C-169]|eukprot:XP_005644367.1 hypothetical protein COCSUDRAFT_44249 [Coccomyxa subellipsoidea C-169]
MPESPVRYVDVPWVVKYSGDSVYGKSPWQRVERVYLVELRDPDERADFSLNLENVFVLDRQTKELSRGQVIRNESINADTDVTTLTLRIRKDGLYLDRYEDMPDIEEIVGNAELEAWEREQKRAREKTAASVASLVGSGGKDDGPDIVQPSMGDADEPQDPINAMSDNDFDGPEDTPAVDLGF